MSIDTRDMESGRIRRPAVAGLFYPGSQRALERSIADCFQASVEGPPAVRPKALIAPHAGYMYSGPVAASAYSALQPHRAAIHRVVLLGPSHFVAFRGLATSSADYFLTPLGPVQLDTGVMLSLLELPFVRQRDDAHAGEHSLEVHLPFLQTVLDEFRLVPLVVGEATRLEVSEVIERAWGGEETLIVVSTDLSHYHPYDVAVRRDSTTSAAIRRLDTAVIDGAGACGYRAVNGLLDVAAGRGLRVTVLDERNSGDTAGDRSRVVGYGAYALS